MTSKMLETAIEAAQAAGAVVERFFEIPELEREEKDDKSFVTKADKESEEIIVSIIRKHQPDHGILGEEGSSVNPDAEYQWVIDPIDATRNFVNGIPIFAISIAVMKGGLPIVGVVYNPVTRSLYSAEAGKGMMYNGKPGRVSTQTAETGIVTFGPGQGKAIKRELFDFISKGEDHFRSVRYLACAALELAYVARGVTEGFVCINLHKWDYAAGWLLIKEAGGTITDYQGNPCDLEESRFIASNGIAHDALLALVQSV